jgi:hypothetical protein
MESDKIITVTCLPCIEGSLQSATRIQGINIYCEDCVRNEISWPEPICQCIFKEVYLDRNKTCVQFWRRTLQLKPIYSDLCNDFMADAPKSHGIFETSI